MAATFTEQDKAMQVFLHWVMDGDPLTSEAEREQDEELPVPLAA